MPLDGVKIDRSLVVDDTHGGPRLLAATIDNAQHLGLKVVAEGIEDADALELVRRLGCDSAQGYHMGRPMSSDRLRALFGTRAGAHPETVSPSHS